MSPYDARFTRVFKIELAKRALPLFPDSRWFDALRSADLEAPCNLPPSQLRPALSAIQVTSHQRRPATEKYLMLSVAAACNRWWNKYGT